MPDHPYPTTFKASEAPARVKRSNYPERLASRMAGRVRRQLADLFGLTNIGVNLTRLPPNSVSALRHSHAAQDESRASQLPAMVYRKPSQLNYGIASVRVVGHPRSLPQRLPASIRTFSRRVRNLSKITRPTTSL